MIEAKLELNHTPPIPHPLGSKRTNLTRDRSSASAKEKEKGAITHFPLIVVSSKREKGS